ncbi:hypothetical protein LOKVESSMR4R_00241 [Yoonia vestfoldensis]|uniref:Uncharacterized protein n=1 Tax=Yoonia vestfoldensis TaxID=245188 RepID=A0A1Y0E7R3_9RHOB|nr:hypothetical protein LOKVESSMR4R_00241 [Yoonia vestfoldensis]
MRTLPLATLTPPRYTPPITASDSFRGLVSYAQARVYPGKRRSGVTPTTLHLGTFGAL